MTSPVACAAAAVAFALSAPLRADEASLSREAFASRAEAHAELASIANAASQVLALFVRARGLHDPVVVSCLDGALSRADVAHRYAREHAARADAAWADAPAP